MGEMEITVKYRAYVKHSDASGLYVSWCPMLDIKSQGTTIEQAKAALDDSVRMLIRYSLRQKTFFDLLNQLGLEASDDEAPDSGESISVRPLPPAPDADDSWWGVAPIPYEALRAHRASRRKGDPTCLA